MMAFYFLGTGAAMIFTGMTQAPYAIMAGLALTGLFASIYHPVGIAWLVRNSENRGTALGINGVFGAIGPGVAALVAGLLVKWVDWQAAFWIPGAVILLTGLAFIALVGLGAIQESKIDKKTVEAPSKNEMVRAFSVLALTMLATGLIYQATQPALPKMLEINGGDQLINGILGISAIYAGIYFIAGIFQVIAGMMADRFPLKWVYLGAFAVQAPFLALVGGATGLPLAVLALIMVTTNVGALPAENALVARYAPANRRGLVFGLKFILAFGVAGLGTKLEAYLFDLSGSFSILFFILAVIAAVGAFGAIFLPSEKQRVI